MNVKEGKTVAILGRNGAGKTTILRSIMSLTPPREGKIVYKGEDITNLSPHKVSEKGLSLVPENRNIFPALNVMDHLRVPVMEGGDWDKLLEFVFDIFPVLEERKNQSAQSLSGGEQQMLVIGRALMTNPKLLLLDEPFEGLAPKIVSNVMKALKKIKGEGVNMLLSSQTFKRALLFADNFYIIEKGKVEWSGEKQELESSPEIRKKYLGV